MAKSGSAPMASTRSLNSEARRPPERKGRRTLHDLTRKEIDALEALFDDLYPASALEVARVLFAELLNQESPGLSVAQAAQTAHAQAEALRKELGGLYMYFTKGRDMEVNRRIEGIVADYNGRNMRDLAMKYGLSHERVRKILADAGAHVVRVRPKS